MLSPHPRNSWTAALLSLAAGLTAFACEAIESEGKSCTLIGCESRLSVAFTAATWPAGTYQVLAQTPTGPRTCTVALPLPSNGQAACTGTMTLGTSGSALPTAQHSLVGVQLADQPTQLTLTVTRDGAELAKKTFAPVYTVSQPNGAGCEPVCKQANEQLSW